MDPRTIHQDLLRIEKQNERTIALLQIIATKDGTMSKELEDLKASVARIEEVQRAAVIAFQGVAAQLQNAKNDPDAIEEIAGQLSRDAESFANAITANTPAAPIQPIPTGGAETDTFTGGDGSDTVDSSAASANAG